MAKPVDFQELAKSVAEYGFAYLITIADNDRIHTSAVQPRTEGERLIVRSVSDRVRANTGKRAGVSLVWPPVKEGGYSLIVDGAAVLDGEVLSVTPTRAILHRPEPGTPADETSCASDCIEI